MYQKKLKNYLRLFAIGTLLPLSISGCEKEDTEIHPFSNITTLDCRNLIIRNVVLNGSFVEVSVENTCKTCEDNWVYLGMVMIDKTTNSRDTLALTECLTCHSCPKNGETQTYNLDTNLSSLPDLKNVQFNFGYLCNDLTVIKK